MGKRFAIAVFPRVKTCDILGQETGFLLEIGGELAEIWTRNPVFNPDFTHNFMLLQVNNRGLPGRVGI